MVASTDRMRVTTFGTYGAGVVNPSSGPGNNGIAGTNGKMRFIGAD